MVVIKGIAYDPFPTDSQQLAHRPDWVEEDQWRRPVHFWGTFAAREKSEKKNKASREKQKMPHTAWRSSFAQVKHEMKIQREGASPSRREVFKKTHTKKDGSPVDTTTAETISKMDELASQHPEDECNYAQDDIFSQVMGPDRHGHVWTFGLGPSPTKIFGKSYNQSHTEMRDDETQFQEKLNTIKVEMEAQMQEQLSRMQEEMQAQMKAQLEAMGFPMQAPHDTTSVPLGTRQAHDVSTSNSIQREQFFSSPSSQLSSQVL